MIGHKQVERRWIFLPIEVKSREFLSRLFFTAYAVKEGFGVFIGRNGLNISRSVFPKGIYFDKCLSAHKKNFHKYQVSTLGNQLVSLDEEGLLMVSEDIYIENRTSQQSIDLSSLVFLWGKEQKRLLESRFGASDKLVLSGSPRLDTWRPRFMPFFESDATKLRSLYGKFILVVSNWGFSGRDKEAGIDPDHIDENDPKSLFRNKFISLIPVLADSFKDRMIIVRPHPTDLKEYWNCKSNDFPDNVKVIHQGPLSPWIHAAQVVIHNNCTTAIETWTGGIETIAYCPPVKDSSEFNHFTMPVNSLSEICKNESDVIDSIQLSYTKEKTIADSRPNEISKQFLHFDKDLLATEIILKHLVDLRITQESYKIQSYGFLKRIRAISARLKWRIRDFLGVSGMYTLDYTLGKNSGLKLSEIQETLTRLSPLIGVEDSFFQVIEVDKDTFCIFGETNVKHNK